MSENTKRTEKNNLQHLVSVLHEQTWQAHELAKYIEERERLSSVSKAVIERVVDNFRVLIYLIRDFDDCVTAEQLKEGRNEEGTVGERQR